MSIRVNKVILLLVLCVGVSFPTQVFAASKFGKCMSAANRKYASAGTKCNKMKSAKSVGLCRKKSFQTFKADTAKCRKIRR